MYKGWHDDVLSTVAVEVGDERRRVDRGGGLGHPLDLERGDKGRATAEDIYEVEKRGITWTF